VPPHASATPPGRRPNGPPSSSGAPTSPVPSFFLVGAFKSGTTALYEYLGQHPEVYLSPRKEPVFFASELRIERLSPEWRRLVEADAEAFARYLERPHRGEPQPRGMITRWEDYLRLFRDAPPGAAIGEGSVAYLWSRTAARSIHERLPDARILMILRNPCDRAYSQYHAVVPSARPMSFGDAIRRSARHGPGPFLDTLDPFLDFGLYADQLGRYLERFPREHVRVYLHEDFVRERERIVRDAFRFLGKRTDVPLDLSQRHNESRVARFPRLESVLRPLARTARRLPPSLRRAAAGARWRPAAAAPMSGDDRRFLIDFYADDVRRLETLLDRDLSAWLR